AASVRAGLESVGEETLLEPRTKIGEPVMKRMNELAATNPFPSIGEVRGLGGIAAIELVEDRPTKKPAAALTKRWAELSLQNGLILLTCGVDGNVARVLVPLTASDQGVGEGAEGS